MLSLIGLCCSDRICVESLGLMEFGFKHFVVIMAVSFVGPCSHANMFMIFFYFQDELFL